MSINILQKGSGRIPSVKLFLTSVP